MAEAQKNIEPKLVEEGPQSVEGPQIEPRKGKEVCTALVSTRQVAIDALYSQKKFARRFGIYMKNLWAVLPELNSTQRESMASKIGEDRLEAIEAGSVKQREITHSENEALLDVVPEERREEIYMATKFPNKTVEFYKRKINELREFTKMIEPSGDRIIDIAGGAGDVARVLSKMTGKDSLVLDFDPKQIGFGKELNQILNQNVECREFDVRNELIPEGTWVAKHPCGDLTDNIIDQWCQNEGSQDMYIMTCCQGKAKNYPNPYGFSESEWRALCKKSDWTNSKDAGKRAEGQEAMDRLDQARVEYLRKRGYDAELKHIPHTIKGNVIIARKNSASK